jgi:hypothetical protein
LKPIAYSEGALMEMFLFSSQGASNAITLDAEGAALPPVQGGWEKFGSIGDLSSSFEASDLDRLRREGFLLVDKRQPVSKNAEDWQPMPRGSFQLTDRALERARSYYAGLIRNSGGRMVLAFLWGAGAIREHGETEWRSLGVRLTLGAYDEADIPPAAVEYIEGLPFLFLFEPEKLPTPQPTMIDFGTTGFVFAD